MDRKKLVDLVDTPLKYLRNRPSGYENIQKSNLDIFFNLTVLYSREMILTKPLQTILKSSNLRKKILDTSKVREAIFQNSLFELSQLNDIAKEAMEPWRISAENRIETLLAVEQFVESIKE